MDGIAGKVTMLQWRDGVVVEPPDLPGALTDLRDPATMIWVDLSDPTAEELAVIGGLAGLNEHAMEDALTLAERPKVARHTEHTFLTMAATEFTLDAKGADRLVLRHVSAFVFPGGLLTVRPSAEPGRGGGQFDMVPVIQAWQDNVGLLRHGVGALVHGLLDVVIDGHFDTIQQMDESAERLEDVLFERQQGRQVQEEVYRLRRDLVALRRAVLPMREVVNAVQRTRNENGIQAELDDWFEDLYDHVLRASEWTESLRDMISAIFETNLSLQNARLNEVMKKLAGWAAVIAVPTAVTGWFGQNVPFPGTGEPLGVAFSVVLILLGTVGVWALLKKFGWI